MPLQPELLMSAEWPEESTRRRTAAQLVEDPWFEAYWPVSALPAEMGMIADAELIPGDPHGCYYAPVSLGFFEDSLHIEGTWEAKEDAETGAELTYEELAHLIDPEALRIYCDVPSQGASTRRVAGFLRLRSHVDDTTQLPSPPSPDLHY